MVNSTVVAEKRETYSSFLERAEKSLRTLIALCEKEQATLGVIRANMQNRLRRCISLCQAYAMNQGHPLPYPKIEGKELLPSAQCILKTVEHQRGDLEVIITQWDEQRSPLEHQHQSP